MAESLTPLQAMEVADAVYGIVSKGNVGTAFDNTEASELFDLTCANSRLMGNSGGVFGSPTGFGVVATGTGIRKGELLIATRGTVFTSASDWYSNVMATMTVSSKPVHSGFNKIFRSIKDELASKLPHGPVRRVHCVGHSLGGALANLVADWMLSEGHAQEAELYTFGAPRVGFKRFSEHLTTTVQSQRIHRVYHHSDVVPMVPVWPFVHCPEPGEVCYVKAPGEGDRPGKEYHAQEEYLESMRGQKWENLHKKAPPTHMDKQVAAWLASDSPLAFTTNTFSLIGSSIKYVVAQAAAMGLQFAVGGVVHAIDALAMFLVKAAQVGGALLKLVGNLMRRIMQAVGVAVVETGNITYQLVKWVLDKLTMALGKVADMAIRLTHRDL